MAFEKARQLIDLATWIASRRYGVRLPEVIERYGCAKRTAQRMLVALEEVFPDTNTSLDPEGRKVWRLPASALREFLTLTPEELAALDLATGMLATRASEFEAERLHVLRDKIVALVPASRISRIETDHEALLEAQGLAARPGPTTRMNPDVAKTVSDALKASERLRIRYRSRGDAVSRTRVIEPYGILLGIRRYLIARSIEDKGNPLRHFLAESIEQAESTGAMFERNKEFDLETHARKAFGAYQREDEHGEVVWKFNPEVADHAAGFRFHPTQTMTRQKDGSLIVQFHASGHLEMCWHLYMWGDNVEVIAPLRLKDMVEGYQRSDFPALP